MICMYVGPNLKLSPWSSWNKVESNRHFSCQDLMLSDAIALHCLKPSRVPSVQGSPLGEALIGGEEHWAHSQGPGSTARPAIHVLQQVIETLKSSVCVSTMRTTMHNLFPCRHSSTTLQIPAVHLLCDRPFPGLQAVLKNRWADGCGNTLGIDEQSLSLVWW